MCSAERQSEGCAVAQATGMYREGTWAATRAVWDSWGKRKACTMTVGLCDVLGAN